MMNSKYVPKRRFKEFESDGEWEQLKLGDHANILTGGTPNTSISSYWEPKEIPWMSSGEVNRRRLDKTDNMISNDGIRNSSARWVKKHSILIALAGQGKTRGMVAVNNIPLTTNQSVAAIEPDKTLNYEFVFQNLSKRYDELRLISSGDGSRGGLNKQIVSDISIACPNVNEQELIGNFLADFDSLITMNQHKLDKLKNLKKAYLSEMFPAEGERVPKRRFPGFEGEWEQKRLTTIASMHARIGWQNLRTSEFLNDGDYYLITGTDFLDGWINFENCYYVDKERYQQDKNIQVKSGSILITKDGTIGKVAIVSHLDKPATLNAGVFNVVIKESNVDEKYLYQYLASPFLMDYVSKRVTGGTIKHLNQGILVDFPINIPVYEEQKAIGRFFEHLDQSITLQQQKLDKLNDLKKAYLNELFV